MSKRTGEPEEAFGPALDGFAYPVIAPPSLPVEEEEKLSEEIPEAGERTLGEPVALLVGSGELTEEVARLASACGFSVHAAVNDESEAESLAWLDAVHVVPDYLDMVSICSIDRDSFVCVFVDSPAVCEDILAQCLATDARYLGVDGSRESCREILSALKSMGAPDAELAAIACPMGLNLDAQTVPQKAVAIVAELLGAWTGALKSLRPGLLGLHR